MAKKFVVRPATQMQPGTITPANQPGPGAGAASNPQVLQVNQGGGGTGGGAKRGPGKTFSLPQYTGKGSGVQWGRAFLSSSGAIPVMWGISMAVIFVDEWHNYHILARPARLWWTSIAFFILAILAHFDKLAVIANLLAIGFTLQLVYQFYAKTGQFSGQ